VGADHDDVRTRALEQRRQRTGDTQVRVRLPEPRRTRCTGGWMAGIDRDAQSAQRLVGIDRWRPPHANDEVAVRRAPGRIAPHGLREVQRYAVDVIVGLAPLRTPDERI